MLKKQFFYSLVLLFSSLFFTVQASASMSIGTYSQLLFSKKPNDKLVLDSYLSGLREGFFIINAANQDKRLFCLPGKLNFDITNIKDMINSQIRVLTVEAKGEKIDHLLIDILLLDGLINEFPCHRSEQ